MSLRDVADVLGDGTFSWSERRTRLQGWRGGDAVRADRAVVAQRLAPAACAVGATAGVATRSPAILAVFAATALAGGVAVNHPFEVVYNRWAVGRGRPPLPGNRAAKRLGCVIGVVFLGGAAVAYALGAPTVAAVLALTLAVTAAFVAVTGICVPSLIFTLLWGTERACAPTLRDATRRPRTTASV